MKPHVSVLGISRFVLICCALLFSWAKGDKTNRRFVGLPESGQRVSHNDTSGNNRTLIIRHNLPGKIIFHEGNEFWIELQTTIPDGQVNNSEVKATYSSFDNETILLQVYHPILQKPVEANEKDKLVLIIVSSVGSFAFLCIIVSALCYFCYWKKRRTLKADGTTKEIPEENSTSDSGRVSQALLGRSRPAGTTPFMIVAVCACVLHAQLQPYNVDINVFFPKGFLRPDSRVFLKSENNNEVRVVTNDTSLKINVFDVTDAGLVSENRCLAAQNLTCVNGACDPMAGKCVCPRKMRAKKDKEGQTRCVYRCDEKCQKGFFEESPCNHTQPAVCKKCRPLCSFQEFESAPCAGKTDRKCTDISQLPPIKVSSNVVHEDVLKVRDDPPVSQVISNISKDSTTWLNRTSGLAIKLKMLRVDFSTTFKEVNHGVNDNDMLSKDYTSQAVLRNFCGSPIPDFYSISVQESVDKVRFIKGHPQSPCPSYDGSPSIIPVARNLLSCNGAENPVLRLFGEKSSPEDLWKEEKSQECYNNKQSCANCRERCTALSRNDPICNVTKEDLQRENKQDYGEHFTYCFDCCFQANCICSNCPCSLYNTSCLTSQVTCVEAKHFTFPIQPIFPKLGDFKCHVEISRGPVFELEASVWKDKALLRRIETSERNNSQRAGEGRDYGFMVLTRPSFLRNDITKDILISGKAGDKKFNVGLYKLGEELSAQGATRRLYIQPKEPFIINSKSWPKENCQTMETDNFITIKPSGSINNFQSFSSLTAKIAYEHNERVYKVYNNSGSHYVHVELPQGRSVLKYAFPETVVLNDRSFAGRLLKNRTFWTIRLTGRVSSCPGFFVVRLTDQDRPDVEVYHYDVAITTEDCSFLVEFHLPSSGDTNSIDKQFVVRLTDSRKTLKLILVSPMGIPDIVIPNIDDDFDLTKLEVLIPFSSAAGGMIIVLIAILIYGYKTRPKDAHHRDRDNQLHFRHVLFVVWFVGMRLLKSFLLTLTVFSVILTAIHYTNVRTLQKYRTFHEEQKDLERAFMKQMDTHRVQEINRQWSVLDKGKLICDQKLKELNMFLEKYFKEMKERQEEEMRRKYIILAAKHRIDNQFKEARVKFERERKRMNEQLSSYSRELNSRLSQIQNKIESSFWLKAARGLYKVLNGIAKTFGKSMKPFIRWVGLSVSFPNIHVSLPSFDDLFDDFALSSLTPHDSESNSSFIEDVFKSDTRISIKEISVPELNISSPFSKGRAKELLALDWIVQLYQSGMFTVILIVLDSLWFIYRHSKTYQLAVVLIHGFPKIYQLEQIQMKEEKKEKKKKTKEDKLQQKARNENDDGNEENPIEKQEKSSKGQDKINGETEIQELEHLQEEEEKKENSKKKKKEEKLQPKGAKKARKENEDLRTIDGKENSLQLQERSGKGKDKINLETKIQELDRIQKDQEKKEKKTKEDNLEKKNAKKARQEKDKGKAIDCSKNSIDLQETFNEGKNKINTEREEKTTEFRDVTSEQDVNTKPTEKEIVNEQDEIDGSETPRNSSKFSEDEPKWKKGINHGLKGVDLLNTAFVKFLVKLKELNYQINNTNLVPMCVLSVIAILSVYVVIVTAKHSMNVETLEVVGYFDLKMAPLLTMRKIVNTRITSSAFLVNEVHIPYYENRVNARIAFYRKKAKMYQAYQCSKADLHNEEYCSWREEESCQGVGAYNQGFLDNLTQFECNLEPVLAQRFIKFDRFRYKERHKKAISPYVAALQGLILDTFYMILIVIGIFIVFKILGIAVFLLLKKFDLVRQVKHYQTNQDLTREMAVPLCIKYPSSEQIEREIRPIQLSEEMRRKFGPTVREGYSTQWVK